MSDKDTRQTHRDSTSCPNCGRIRSVCWEIGADYAWAAFRSPCYCNADIRVQGIDNVHEFLDKHDLSAQNRIDRIAYGDETTRHRPDGRKSYIAREAERCPDCQVGQGELHEAGCDVEQCPECKRQLIRCDHVEIRPIEQYIPGWFAHKLDMHDIGYKRVRPGEMEELLSTHAYHHDLPPRDQ